MKVRKSIIVVGALLIGGALNLLFWTQFVMPSLGLYVALGNSLKPEIGYFSISLEVPMGPGEVPEVGKLYTYRRQLETVKTPVQSLRHRMGWRFATKWCHAVSENGRFFETATDDSYDHPIPVSDIVRKVVYVWDFNRFLRGFTEKGEFRNWGELAFAPWQTHWSPNGKFLAVKGVADEVMVYSSSELVTTLSGAPYDLSWDEDTLRYFTEVTEGGVSYSQEMVAEAPRFFPREKPMGNLTIAMPGYQVVDEVGFSEMCQGDERKINVPKGAHLLLYAPGDIKVALPNGESTTFSPGEDNLLPVGDGGEVLLSIPEGPPFDVPMPGGGRTRVIVLVKKPALA